MRENKLTQTLKQNDSSVEGLECLVLPINSQMPVRKVNVPKRNTKVVRHRSEAYQEASSSGSNNELSSLLPAPRFFTLVPNRREAINLLTAVRTERTSPPPRRCSLKRSTRVYRKPQNPLRGTGRRSMRDTAIARSVLAGHGTHCAKSFNDTSDGSVHCFLDEHGNWVTYTFDEKGLGTANTNVPAISSPTNPQEERPNKLEVSPSNSAESVSVILDTSVRTYPHSNSMIPTRMQTVANERLLRSSRNENAHNNEHAISMPNAPHLSEVYLYSPFTEASDDVKVPLNRFRIIQAADTLNNNFPATKSYYKFKVFPWTYIKVTLDRLKLLALLDRNLTLCETLLSIILGVLVSVLGAYLLYLGFYEDLSSFVFCLIIASCQYSLLKSVQPDAASPTHGFNRVIAYSRPIYFSIFASIVLCLHSNISEEASPDASLYDMKFSNTDLLIAIRDFFVGFILFFPFLFSLGLFPQINTFLLYILEQIDMHIFGGNAMSSLSGSFYCVFRSVLAVFLMFGLVFGALAEVKSSQHILFSVFCACLVTCSYHLSRSASDPSHVWSIIKKNMWPPDVYREHKRNLRKPDNDTEQKPDSKEIEMEKDVEKNTEAVKEPDHADPLPEKLRKTVNARLKSDVIVCSLIALLVFGIHASTVFTVLQPNLCPIMWCILGSLGFFLHYIIPQLRKQLPWLCIARPVLRSQEHDKFQIAGPANVMWFEMVGKIIK